MSTSPTSASHRCRVAAPVLLLAAAVLALTSCGPEGPARPNVLLVVVDTLRPDHLGCYGHERETTPTLDGLARDGYRFERAYSTAPWTMPSVASMLTGLYPGSHGVERFTRLPDEATTLAEVLSRHGYATGGVVSHLVLTDEFNFQQGFERYKNRAGRRPHYEISTESVTTGAETLLEGWVGEDRPFFLFAHYFDPHFHYLNHAEIDFAAPRAGRLDGTETIHDLRAMAESFSAGESEFVRDLYDEEIRHTDDGIGRLLGRLAELGLDENTWIIVTADHGEELSERGWVGHTRTLYEELVRVPLIVRPPAGAGAGAGPTTIDRLTSLVSLTPTILDIAGIDPSPYPFQGGSLLPLLQGAADTPPDAVYAEVDFVPLKADNAVKRTQKKTVITGRLKLIRDELGGKVELYDLGADPGELRDLAAERPDLVEGMRPVLEQAIAFSRRENLTGEDVILSDERLEELRALGYVGK